MRYVLVVLDTIFILFVNSNLCFAQDFRIAPPNEIWETVESEHFSITFPQHDQQIAFKLIDIAEHYYPIMTKRMGWEPARKTYILISNATDDTNAETTTYYYNHIVIFTVPPDAYSSIINYDDWLKMIFVHEYTHVLHLDQTRGFFGFLNRIFGRILFVNMIEPDWFIEGYAVYNESTLTSAGRDNGSYYNTILRTQALHNALPSIEQGDGMPSKWPFGEYPYIYGGKFLQYLANQYSDKALADYSEQYTYLPLFLNTDAKLVFNKKSFLSLWKDWQTTVRINSMIKALSVIFAGTTGAKQITGIGAYTRGPVWDANGKGIFYTSYNGKSQMGIFYTDLKNNKHRFVVRRNSGFSNSICQHYLFFAQDEFFDNFYLYNDLYELDMQSNKVRRLTYGLRVHGADASSDCTKIVFASNTSNSSELMLYHIADPGFITTIATIKGSGQFLNPRWSWNGKYIAVTIKDNTGNSSIKIMDRQGQIITTVISNSYLNLFPSWSRDDNFVIFSSDMSGIANLYAYSLTEQTLYQVTNVISGAYESQISPDNKIIVFTAYDNSGFNVYEMPFSPATFKQLNPENEFIVQEVEHYNNVAVIKKQYSPFSTLKPTWWLPTVSLSSDAYSFEVYTAGSDLLEHHAYTLQVGYTAYPTAKWRPGFSVSYDNKSFPPNIGISGSMLPYIAMTYTDPINGKRHSYIQQDNSIAISVTYPINHVRYVQSLGGGYQYSYIKSLIELPSYITNQPFSGVLTGLFVNYSIDTTSMYNTSISKENGVYFNTYFEKDLSEFGSDRDIFLSNSIIKGYIPGFSTNHVIYIKGVYGIVSGVSQYESMFSIGGTQGQYLTNNYTNIAVRGYPSGWLIGTQLYALSLEYRCPVGIIDRGISTLPFYLDKISIFPFLDLGSNIKNTITSTGVELNLDTYIGYLFPFRFTIGYAYAYNIYPASAFYFLLGEKIQ